jgi:hypothetical protein
MLPLPLLLKRSEWLALLYETDTAVGGFSFIFVLTQTAACRHIPFI